MSNIGKEFEVQLGKRVDAAVNRGVPRTCINNRGVRWGTIRTGEAIDALLTPVDLKDLRLEYGDVLVCEGGEIGRAAMWRNQLPEAYFLNTLHRLRSRGRMDPRVLVALLERWSSTGELAALVGKATLAHLTKENLVKASIPVPPGPEQRAIGDALDDVDNLIATLERLIAKKQAIKQGMMHALLTGRTRLPGFAGGWSECQIGDFADVKAGGTPSTSVPRYWGGDVRWMSSGEIHGKRISDVAGRITAAGLRESAAQLLPSGTVLMALAGQGKTRGTVAVSRVALSTNQSIAGILPSPAHDPDFLYYNLDTRYAELRGESSGEGGRGGLNLTIIKKLRVLMPGVTEQRAIAAVLETADDELDLLEVRLTKARAIKQGMMQELLTGRTRLPAPDEVAS